MWSCTTRTGLVSSSHRQSYSTHRDERSTSTSVYTDLWISLASSCHSSSTQSSVCMHQRHVIVYVTATQYCQQYGAPPRLSHHGTAATVKSSPSSPDECIAVLGSSQPLVVDQIYGLQRIWSLPASTSVFSVSPSGRTLVLIRTSTTSALLASSGYDNFVASGVHLTPCQLQHSSTLSCRPA